MRFGWIRQASAVIAALSLAAGLPVSTAFAGTEEETIYRLRNVGSGEYLTVDGEMAQKEGNLITKAANGTLKQEFLMTGEDSVTFISQSNQQNLAVNVWGSRTQNGSNINLWEQTGEKTQEWILVPTTGGYLLQSADNKHYVMGTYLGNVQAEAYKRGDNDQVWELIETKLSVGESEATALSLSAEYSVVNRNETMQVELTCEPEDSNLRLLAWKSSNSGVLSVDQHGVVTAKDNGTAVITAELPGGIQAKIALEVRDDKPITPVKRNEEGYTSTEEEELSHFSCMTPMEWEFLEMIGGDAYLIRDDGAEAVWLPTQIFDVQEYDENYEEVLPLGYLKGGEDTEEFQLIDAEKYTTVTSDTVDWFAQVTDTETEPLCVDYEALETGIWVWTEAADGNRYHYRISTEDFERYRNGFQGDRELYYGWVQDGVLTGLFQAEPIVVTDSETAAQLQPDEPIEEVPVQTITQEDNLRLLKTHYYVHYGTEFQAVMADVTRDGYPDLIVVDTESDPVFANGQVLSVVDGRVKLLESKKGAKHQDNESFNWFLDSENGVLIEHNQDIYQNKGTSEYVSYYLDTNGNRVYTAGFGVGSRYENEGKISWNEWKCFHETAAAFLEGKTVLAACQCEDYNGQGLELNLNMDEVFSIETSAE